MVMKYLVVSFDDVNDFYIVDDLNVLISDIYSCELENNSFDVVKGWFNQNYKVFVSDSDIKEVVN
jgi:hypothetical protein